MISLIFSIICSAAISIVMRAAQKYTKNNVSMLMFNYVMCVAFACFFTLTESGSVLPQGEGSLRTLLLGLVNGCLYLAAFLLLQYNISRNGVVLASTFMKLGVLVPTLAAMLVFGEKPSVMQIAGFILAVAAIILINGKDNGRKASAGGALLLVLLAGGCADAMSKVYETYGTPELKSQFLMITFFTALVLCMATTAIKKQRIAGYDILFGLLIGIPNYLSSRLLLISLGSVPAVIAYPTFSVGTIVLVSLVSMLFFKEKLSIKQWIAMAIILGSLVLLNI